MKNKQSSSKNKLPLLEQCSVCIIGLGYVGLPLAVQIAKTRKSFKNKLNLKRKVIGFDINFSRIKNLKRGIDSTLEVKEKELLKVQEKKYLELTTSLNQIKNSDIFIVTVPTPIDKDKKPELSLIKKASIMIGECLFNMYLNRSGRVSSI